MNQEIINSVMYKMNPHLDNQQLMELKEVLEIVIDESEDSEDDSFELLNRFIVTKKLEGRSDKMLKYYKNTVGKMLQGIEKNVHNARRDLSSFFTWL